MKIAINPRVNIPLTQEIKRRAEALAKKRHLSLSKFLQEAIEQRLRREAKAELDRRLEQAAKEMAEEDRKVCQEWEAVEAEADELSS